MIESLADTYSAVLAPELFVLACSLALVGYEWRALPGHERSLAGLGARVGVLAAAWGVAFAVYQGVPALLGPLPAWGTDVTGSLGLGVGLCLIWWVWRAREWGPLVPELAALLVVATVPHLFVTPFWDLSSHVLYAAVPAGYLALVDRRFVALLVVPLGMVASRPLAGAHTWAESVAGLALGAVVLLGHQWLARRDAGERGAETAAVE